jgi:hypothetical protein
LRLAGGRTTDDELRKDARERQQKSRAKKKIPRPAPKLDSFRDVTESLPKPEPKSVEQKTFDSPQAAREQAGAALRAAITALLQESKRHIHFENALSPDAFSKADIESLIGKLESFSKFQKRKREAA